MSSLLQRGHVVHLLQTNVSSQLLSQNGHAGDPSLNSEAAQINSAWTWGQHAEMKYATNKTSYFRFLHAVGEMCQDIQLVALFIYATGCFSVLILNICFMLFNDAGVINSYFTVCLTWSCWNTTVRPAWREEPRSSADFLNPAEGVKGHHIYSSG